MAIEALNTTVEESGFDRGLQPEKILGVLPQRNRPLKFLIKWKNTDEKSFVTSEEACFMCAPMVFAYFEARLKFSSNGTFDNVIRERDSRIWFQSNYEPVEILGVTKVYGALEVCVRMKKNGVEKYKHIMVETKHFNHAKYLPLLIKFYENYMRWKKK